MTEKQEPEMQSFNYSSMKRLRKAETFNTPQGKITIPTSYTKINYLTHTVRVPHWVKLHFVN